MTKTKLLLATAAFAVMAACSPQTAPTAEADAEAAAVAATAAPVQIAAPAGEYKLDPTHASLTFQVQHLGLSNYTARFTQFDATLNFDPANPANSRVTATINPASIRTDYTGNYRATHQGSPYRTFDEALTRDPNWFNVGAHPQITFESTGIELTGERTGTMTGNLTFLGQTHPVTLDVKFNGELNPHPFLQGRSAIGFSASGALDRSQWGMTQGVNPTGPGIGDTVSLIIEAEFHQVAAAAPAAAPATP